MRLGAGTPRERVSGAIEDGLFCVGMLGWLHEVATFASLRTIDKGPYMQWLEKEMSAFCLCEVWCEVEVLVP